MITDDDALDRALAALPLEEPPADLHARIMACTVGAGPAPIAPIAAIRSWELWVIGVMAALAVWLMSVVVAQPNAGERLGNDLAFIVQNFGLGSMQTWLWLAIGASAALWASALSVPHAHRVKVR